MDEPCWHSWGLKTSLVLSWSLDPTQDFAIYALPTIW